MKGELKNGDFYIGDRNMFSVPQKGRVVTITDTENHPIYGERYKIPGCKEWFEKNCFEWIREEE